MAIFVASMCALMVAATMPVASAGRNKGNLVNRASGLCQKELESIRGEGYVNLNPSQLASFGLIDSATAVSPNTYSFTNSDSANLDNPAKVLPQGAGTVNLTVVNQNITQITVTVTWVDSTGPQSFSAGTLLANL